MKKIILFLTIYSFIGCSLLEEGTGTVHFNLADSYGGTSFVVVEIDGVRKNAFKTGDVDPCDGGNYVGFATFSGIGAASYKVFSGTEQVGTGTITYDGCSSVTLY